MVLPHFSPTVSALELWHAQPFTAVQCLQKACANSTVCSLCPVFALWPLTICLWERDPCLLPLFYLWTVLCLHGDTLMWIIKWDAGPACAAWGQWSWIYLQQLRNSTSVFVFLLKKSEPFIFCCIKKTPHNDYFGRSFPICSGLSLFISDFILKSGQNPFKMLYLPVSCVMTKRMKNKSSAFYLTKRVLRYVLERSRKQIPGPS